MSTKLKMGASRGHANGVVNRMSTGLLDGLFNEPTEPPRRKPQAMSMAIETISPKKAANYLAYNTRNRQYRQRRVDKFAQLMSSGRFQLTHQGIAFAPDGALIDGQHRLKAIVQSGVTAKMVVARNAPDASVPVLDLPEIRTIPDLAGALGLGVDITNQVVAVAKCMRFSVKPVFGSYTHVSNEDWINYVLRHEQAIKYAVGGISSALIRHCSFRSVVARAWYTVDRSRLDDFCEVLCSGAVDSLCDNAAIKVRDLYLSGRRSFGGNKGRMLLYRKTEAALASFLKRKPLQRLHEASEELFPIPGDE